MNKKAPIALLMFLLILVASGFALARFRENKQPIKEYHNYNPVTEVSQERLDDWRNLAQKTAKQNEERIIFIGGLTMICFNDIVKIL